MLIQFGVPARQIMTLRVLRHAIMALRVLRHATKHALYPSLLLRCVIQVQAPHAKSHYLPDRHLKLISMPIRFFGVLRFVKVCIDFFHASKFWPTYQGADKMLSAVLISLSAGAGPANNV